MAIRRFGPTRGAGVAIVEQEGDKVIEPGELGFVGYAAVWEKGPVAELSVVLNKTKFLKRHGSFIEDSLAPDAAIDYFDVAAGAGGMVVVRVTDGNEKRADHTFFQRKIDSADSEPLAAPMGKVKAKNGGRWGGKELRFTADLSGLGKLTETTLDTENAFKVDEWKGGFIELQDVLNIRYPIIGNTAAGVITVEADQTMLFDHSGGGDLRYYLTLENEGKEVSILIQDGEDLPDAEFALTVFVDGGEVKKYANLNTDPVSGNFWVNVINNDDGNDEIEVENLVTGAHVASTRPANHYGVINTVTATVLTQKLADFAINSPGGGDPTFAIGATDDDMRRQTITVTMTSATAGDAVSDKFGALGTVTLGSLFTQNNKWSPPFTITAGGSPLTGGDTLVIEYLPFVANQLEGGFLFPDKPNAKRVKFRIVSNDHKSITVVAGSDLTADGAPGDEFLVEATLPLEEGRDGNSELVDADFEQQAWDADSSPFNQTEGKNLGLVKFGTPGNTATAVQKAGRAYALAKNHQYRYEIPANIVTEAGAEAFINDTLGRSEYTVVAFPSFGSVSDPEAITTGKLKQIPLIGAIHGREARIASDFDGYHKAEAGLDATLPRVLEITTGDLLLDEEFLNPVGIQIIKKRKGNFIIWGDRTIHVDPQWRFKHQREQMSFYEHVLQEEFEFIVFAINDPIQDKIALTSLRLFFEPEFVKRALRGDTFEEAAIIKIDKENNTDATRAVGDVFADISLRLADTIERFIIRIGKQGIFESVG
ncbi:MAG: hypothetical protein IH991_06210 [Planctomycetes bacterium]|nr:hypothetical protein [Planctomycetota bacterium]